MKRVSRVKRSIYISGSSELLNKLVNFLAVVLYARLLTPDELGTFAIASSIMIFAIEVRLLGTSSYLIRESEISPLKIRSALGLSMTISWSLAAILILSSNIIAGYYQLPSISSLIILLSFNLLLSPYTSTISALLSRKFHFGKLMAISLPSNVSGLIITIICIEHLSLSYFSLAVGQVAAATLSFFIAVCTRPSEMKFLPAFSNFIIIAKVGFYTSFINLFGRLESIFADLVFGKTNGPSFVAIFSRAMGLQLFIRDTLVSGISGIILPYFSKKYHEGICPRKTYNETNILVTGFLIPPLLCATILSQPLILLMFGEQWESSVVFAKILGAWISIKSLTFLANPALIILKKEKELFYYRAISFLILCTCIIAAVNFEPINIAYAFVFSSVCEFLLLTTLLKTAIGLKISQYFINLKSSFLVALVCGLICWVSYHFFEDIESNLIIILFEGALLIPTWLIAIVLFSHPLQDHLPSLKNLIGK